MRKMTMTALILGGCLMAASPVFAAGGGAGGGAAGGGAGGAGTGTGMGTGTGAGRTGSQGTGMPSTNAPSGTMNRTGQPGVHDNGNCPSSAAPGSRC